MSESSTPSPNSPSKKVSLSSLLPEKAAVPTSLGMLYVRHVYGSDWEHLEGDDEAELGKAAVRRLSSRVQQKRDSSPLADDDVDAMVDADYAALAPVIAKKSGWGELPPGAAGAELGKAVKRGREQEAERNRKMLDDMHNSIGGSYAFLQKDTLQKLQGQMAGLASIRESLGALDSFKTSLGSAGLLDRSTREALAGFRPTTETLRDLSRGASFARLETPRSMDIPVMPALSRPEETVLGRATLESAENSREAVRRMDALVEVVGGLNQTMVQDVLPAWFKQVESDQKQAEEAFRHAGRSLWWTKWAVIASVMVSFLATWWQISVARDIDRENSAAQRTTESLLREQLVAQQKQSEQHALEAAQLRQLVEQQSRDAERLRELLDAKLPPPNLR